MPFYEYIIIPVIGVVTISIIHGLDVGIYEIPDMHI